jgi:hypothetical protein
MKQNYWNYFTDLSNIGGLLGLGFDSDNSLWQSPIVADSAQFGIFLGWENDLDWWLQRVGKTKVQPPSILSFGKQSSVTQIDRSTSKQIVLESL